jgi:hypothetical protein
MDFGRRAALFRATVHVEPAHRWLLGIAVAERLCNDQLEFGAADKDIRQQVPLGQLEQHMRRGLYGAEMNRAARETTSRLPMDLVLRGDVAGRNNWTLTQALESTQVL